MEVKEKIIQYRMEKEITKEELCKEIGISIPTFILIENGNFQDLSVLTKAKVLNFLKNKNIL